MINGEGLCEVAVAEAKKQAINLSIKKYKLIRINEL